MSEMVILTFFVLPKEFIKLTKIINLSRWYKHINCKNNKRIIEKVYRRKFSNSVNIYLRRNSGTVLRTYLEDNSLLLSTIKTD